MFLHLKVSDLALGSTYNIHPQIQSILSSENSQVNWDENPSTIHSLLNKINEIQTLSFVVLPGSCGSNNRRSRK